MQEGIGVKEALFPSPAATQMAVSPPSSSNPESHEKVAVPPTELLSTSTPPLAGGRGSSHSAEKKDICTRYELLVHLASCYHKTYVDRLVEPA